MPTRSVRPTQARHHRDAYQQHQDQRNSTRYFHPAGSARINRLVGHQVTSTKLQDLTDLNRHRTTGTTTRTPSALAAAPGTASAIC
jgi:hypothetical protein